MSHVSFAGLPVNLADLAVSYDNGILAASSCSGGLAGLRESMLSVDA
jgi:hypothetical protein